MEVSKYKGTEMNSLFLPAPLRNAVGKYEGVVLAPSSALAFLFSVLCNISECRSMEDMLQSFNYMRAMG